MAQQSWRFINTGCNTAALNMALDEALLLHQESGLSLPTLRVYDWDVPTLSLGYAQDMNKDVDIEACQHYGVAVVRRPTGGRAVLHDQEVTYSVTFPLSVSEPHRSITTHYRRIGLALAAALQNLGLPVVLARSHVRPASPRRPASPACFAALSRYELSVDGRKLVGSAQKQTSYALLQHGSIPLWIDRHRLFRCLRVTPAEYDRLVQEAQTTMTAVNEVSRTPVNAEQVYAALRDGFGVTYHTDLLEAPVLPAEWESARQLQATKYATEAWNIGGAAAWRRRQVAVSS